MLKLVEGYNSGYFLELKSDGKIYICMGFHYSDLRDMVMVVGLDDWYDIELNNCISDAMLCEYLFN